MKKLFLFALSITLCFGLTLAPKVDSSTVHAASPALAAVENPDLDFTLVNATGYPIKGLYIGASGTGDWIAEDEVLHGRKFPNGQALAVKFHPRATAEKWDIMVEWDDGSGKVEWENLKLTQITKVTLHYNESTKETSASIE